MKGKKCMKALVRLLFHPGRRDFLSLVNGCIHLLTLIELTSPDSSIQQLSDISLPESNALSSCRARHPLQGDPESSRDRPWSMSAQAQSCVEKLALVQNVLNQTRVMWGCESSETDLVPVAHAVLRCPWSTWWYARFECAAWGKWREERSSDEER